MSFIVVAAIKDVRRRLADRAALAIWIGLPLLLGGLMSIVAGDEGPPRARILVVDADNTLLSRALVRVGGGGGDGNVFDLEEVSLEEGRRRIGEGDGTALLVVPQGFQRSILEETPATIELVTNPAERILPGTVQEALEILVEGAFYLQRLFGPTLRQMTGATGSGPPSNADVAAVSVAINERLAQVQDLLVPPALQLEVRVEHPQDGGELNFGQVFLPGILFMSFLFIATGMSVDIWTEKARGTLRRLMASPQTARRLLAGKLVGGALLMMGIALAGLLASVAFFDVAWWRVPLALVWSVFAGTALIALLTLVQTLASSQRGGEMLSTIVVFPLMMIGGSFFPFEVMPGWMASVGQWTPNGLAVLRLKDLLYGTPSATLLATSAVGIAIPAAAAFFLTARRLRGRFAVS